MTENVSYETMDPYKNPDCQALENLKLEIKTNGVVKSVDALNEIWASNHYFLHYETPNIYNDDGLEIPGAKQQWIEIVNYIINDLKWLLGLPFYRFWSNIVFNTSILDTLVSFLQDAPPFYALENFPNSPEMLELLETLSHYVLVVFARLVTNKESSEEYMNRPFLGNLLYEKYIFTVPIIFDLCQLYGRENAKIMERILNSLFTLEPQYNNDLQKTVPCLIEALENVERKFDGCSTYTTEAVSLSKQNINSSKLTLFQLEDMILYVLDISSTISVFLKNYPPAVNIFHIEDFMNKLVSVYESTIPEMYKILKNLACNDENMPKYVELKHRLDVTRIEILNLFRIIIYEPILNIQENLNTIKEAEVKERVDEYFNLLSNAISEKEFITDYDQFYPVKSDLTVLSNICPDDDIIKYDYILQSVNAIIGKPNILSASVSNEPIAGPSGISSRTTLGQSENVNSLNEKQIMSKDSVQFASLVSNVKDILHQLDEGFIKSSLEYYNYDSAAVINAVLQDSLPPELKELLEKGSPLISNTPPTYTETAIEDITNDIERLNMVVNYNNDNVYVKKPEIIDIPKEYITKNYSLVEDVYDDEYDDTYDNNDIRGTQDDSTEVDLKPFTIPRILREKQKIEIVSESESEDENTGNDQNGKDCFVQNPEEVRARAEQRRQMRSGKTAGNVVGNPKGQGQEKNVLYNRQQKNVKKAKHANHNRRSGAQWKRNQGMVPS
ncbi:activating signal cointegrator 1 complex subunit 2 [Frieseomelitta varia]|uniref:activating signal cointegrator 1 complex subunit 2 n=1 Tax=Frieseomelitta varia TaxID=561572 RepID=UPI001CB69217|nr:activating signal cointegrator 1 complex subunit 2 [Frieseomelitta varia]